MKAEQFCFWLQGCFELNELPSFDEVQTECIQRHVALVFAHETNRGTRAYEFCAGLRGHFELNKDRTTFDEAQTSAIKAALHKVFTHEIDPSMGGPAHQDKLNGIHTSPARPPLRPGETLLRC
jgi:hypothetical protein